MRGSKATDLRGARRVLMYVLLSILLSALGVALVVSVDRIASLGAHPAISAHLLQTIDARDPAPPDATHQVRRRIEATWGGDVAVYEVFRFESHEARGIAARRWVCVVSGDHTACERAPLIAGLL